MISSSYNDLMLPCCLWEITWRQLINMVHKIIKCGMWRSKRR